MTINTHCGLRLGDNLAALHFLRALAKANPTVNFRHAAHVQYLHQMTEVVYDLENIRLIPFDYHAIDSVDLWKNADGYWEKHPKKNDYSGFMLEFFARMANELGFAAPFSKPMDLLFDYPALQKKEPRVEPFDILVVNSPALSGQALRYNVDRMDHLIRDLAGKHKILTTHPSRIEGISCTAKHGYTVTDIGNCSLFCKTIVMVSTGPSWPTLNVWNQESVGLRVVILEHERLNLGKNEHHVPDSDAARKVLQEQGLL